MNILLRLLPTQPHTPIHKGIHKGGAAEGRPPFVEAAEGRLLYGWVCGGWGGGRRSKIFAKCKCLCIDVYKSK